MAGVPFGSLTAQRSRVLPTGGVSVLGNLAAGFSTGLERGRELAAYDEAGRLMADYALSPQGQGAALGSLISPPGASPNVGFNGVPSQANADLQTALTPGSETFDGRFALRRENASQQNPASAITYDFGAGTVRNQPVSPDLANVLNAAAASAGIDSVIVGSGGQPAAGEGGARTGSTRHDHGGAADLQLVANGRVLDFTNPADLPIIEAFVSAAQANGATGFGAGTDYMGNTTLHVGFGTPGVWGAGGSGANAPDWLAAAAGGGAGAATPAAPAYPGGWQPPSPQEQALLRAMIINPQTRDMAYAEAVRRMTPPAPVQADPFTLSAGETRFDGAGNVVASMPATPAQPDYGFVNVPNVGLVRTNDVAGTAETVMPAPPPGPDFNNEESLRDNFRMETSDYRLIEGHYARLQAAAAQPSAAGDIAMVYAFMKMLDPGSVVRETEYATAQNAAGVPDQVRNLWNRVLSGQRLGEDQRADFLTQAGNTFAATQTVFNQTVARYRDLATQYQMDPNRVLGIGGVVPPTVAAPPTAGAAQPSNGYPRLPADTTAAAAAFNALPSGAFFYDPEGNLRQKP